MKSEDGVQIIKVLASVVGIPAMEDHAEGFWEYLSEEQKAKAVELFEILTRLGIIHDDGESGESKLPSLPDGWTPANTPPNDSRNVRVILADMTEGYGWDAGFGWVLFRPNVDISRLREAHYGTGDETYNSVNYPQKVIGWKEL